jgi:hypothetical protein
MNSKVEAGMALLNSQQAALPDNVTRTQVRWLRRGVWIVAVIGLALRLAFALLPLSTHLIVLEDDAWMVTAIARNFALGLGITADGANPTTGFQPLYPLTLGALPYLIAPDALDAGFNANLVICALLNTLAIWPLWWLARRFGGELAGFLAATLFSLNPYLLRISVNGMETSMGLLMLLSLFVAFYKADHSNLKHMLGLAVLTALAVLARLDASLAFGAITLTMGLELLQAPTKGASLTAKAGQLLRQIGGLLKQPRVLLPILTYVVGTMLLLTPYFIFNKTVGGSFGPSSGKALTYMHSYGPGKTPAERGDYHLTNGLNAFSQNSAIDLDWIPAPWMLGVLIILMAALLVWALRWRLLGLLPLLIYLPIPPLYYGYLLQQARARYFVGISAVLIILLAWLGAELWRRRSGRLSAVVLAAATCTIIALNTGEAIRFYHEKLAETDQTQPTMYQAALWIRDTMPADALIGAKNSGILQYYSGHVILNIDGKLNHEIVPVMERRELLDYLRSKGITYLIDREEIMARHITFYSHQLSDAPTHHAPSLIERAVIYGKILANRLGAKLPLNIASRDDFTPTRQFSDVAEIVMTFARPNQASNPVVMYRLMPTDAPGVP